MGQSCTISDVRTQTGGMLMIDEDCRTVIDLSALRRMRPVIEASAHGVAPKESKPSLMIGPYVQPASLLFKIFCGIPSGFCFLS